MQAFAIASGTLLQGEYRLIDRIGAPTSSVFRARRSSDGRIVAIRLWRGSGEHGNPLELARAASRIKHPTIALTEASGQLEDGTYYIVSEYVEGVRLDVWADVAGIAPMPSVIDLLYRMCAGLNAAHRNGLSHAALHARNFIVRETRPLTSDSGATPRLDVKILDLGVPAFMHAWPPPLHAAQFMAPEQLKNVLPPAQGAPSEATPLMNVYSCGALLYSLCTGGPPHPSKSLEELFAAHAARRLVPPSRINPQVIPALDSIVLTALDPDPQHRFASASQLASALIGIRFERSLSGVRPRVPTPIHETQEIELEGLRLAEDGFDERATSETLASDLTSVRTPSTRPSSTAAPRISQPPIESPPLDEATLDKLSLDEPTHADPVTMVPDRPDPRRRRMPQPPRVALWIGAASACLFAVILFVIDRSAQHEQEALVAPLHETPNAAPGIQSDLQRNAVVQAPIAPVPKPSSVLPTREPPDHDTPAEHARGIRASSKPRQASRPSSRDAPDADPSPTLVVRSQPTPSPTLAPTLLEAAETLLPLPDEPGASIEPPAAPVAPAAPATRSAIEPRAVPKATPAAPKLLDEARIFDLSVKGSLATSQVRRGVDRAESELRACYRAARASARPSELKELTMEIEIDERGRARTARVMGAAPAALKQCLQGAAQRIVVAPPDTGTVVATWKVSVLP